MCLPGKTRFREIATFQKPGQSRQTTGPESHQVVKKLREIQNSVSMFTQILPLLLNYLHSRCTNFTAGQVKLHYSAWTKLTSDKDILSDVLGVSIQCDDTPVQHKLPTNKHNENDTKNINLEVQKLLTKGVIEEASYDPEQIISTIFLTPKKDGTHRLILNLKKFNEVVTNYHFKMDSLGNITKLVTQKCYMACIDTKDAYYSIPIKQSDRKYLRFHWENKTYQFSCLPNGLACAPWKFTEILKPVVAHLKGTYQLLTWMMFISKRRHMINVF